MDNAVLPYFFYSAGILLREGSEALLVVMALAATVAQAGERRTLRFIYEGAAAAVVVSAGLAWMLNHTLSDDVGDGLEGLFQLIAAATLFYVSSWLTARSQAGRWNAFVKAQVKRAQASTAPALALGLTAFMAVMREGAESIVFFQALMAGASAGAERHAVALGIGAAALALTGIWILFHKAASRIPIGGFFAVTSAMLYALAVVFTGQGLASLQEAGYLKTTFVDHIPTIDVLGIHPTVETLTGQLLLVAVALAAVFSLRRRTAAAVSPVAHQYRRATR